MSVGVCSLFSRLAFLLVGSSDASLERVIGRVQGGMEDVGDVESDTGSCLGLLLDKGKGTKVCS